MTICCDVLCPQRFECKQFLRALDVNSGKEKVYEEVRCKDFNQFEK